MTVPGLSDSAATSTDEAVKCSRCGSAIRVAGEACASCLLGEALDLDREPSDEAFAGVLDEAGLPDNRWRLGNYEILEEIGRGGMGVIYRARQRHSRRIVAVKRVLSYHADSQETMQRFRREAEAAASLDHPNILPIYEVSESSDGVPFFSMKYASGGSLRDAAAALRKNMRASVALIMKVARAVDYANQQGLLHRDLKPGNVLLDARGEPLVSDFGLAKWLDENSDLTRTLTIFGTPGYIAPEQLNGQEKLTTAADIYSVGAILFDLLAGRPPFIGSHALSVIRQASESAAPKLRSLCKVADRDLETICAKCLEREPTARYPFAGDLADDLERWLQSRPIAARRVLAPARVWRWSRRNPALVATAIVCLAVGAAAILFIRNSSFVQRRSNPQTHPATAEETRLRQALVKYPELELQFMHLSQPFARNEANTQNWIFLQLASQFHLSEKVVRSDLVKLAEKLRRHPDAASYERASAAYICKDYIEGERIALQAADEAQNNVPARKQDGVGAFKLAALAAYGHQEYTRALEHLREAEKLCDQQDRLTEWISVQLERLLVLLEQQKGVEAEQLARTIVDRQTRLLGPERPETLRTRSRLARSLTEQTKYRDAEAEMRDVITLQEKTLGADNPETMSSIWFLGFILMEAGDNAGAETAFRRAYTLRERILGPEHPDTLRSRNGLAGALSAKKDGAALSEYRELLKVEEKVLGPEHVDTLRTLLNIGYILARDRREFSEAESVMRELLARHEKARGSEHSWSITSRGHIASVLFEAGKYADAEVIYSETLRLSGKTVGPEGAGVWINRALVGFTLDEQGKHRGAEEQLRQALSVSQKTTQPTSFFGWGLNVRAALARNLWYQGRNAEAEAELRAVIPSVEIALGSKAYNASNNSADWAWWLESPVMCRTLLANTLRDQQRYAEADAEYRAVIELEEKLIGSEDRNTLETYYNFAYQLALRGRTNEAKEFAICAAKGAPKNYGPIHPYTHRYQAFLDKLETGAPINLSDVKFRDALAANELLAQATH